MRQNTLNHSFMSARRFELYGNKGKSEAARAALMKYTQWHDLETGRRPTPGCDVLYRVAQALHCTMEELINKD